ncbi:hypothetical protein FHU30_002234 [Actinomadura rupiterrae]|nr:hypothetical protein [Actinomadura rupiterrae]
MRAAPLKSTRIVLPVRNSKALSAAAAGGTLGAQAYGHLGPEGVGPL